jgi:hypothetical protein
MKEQENTIPDNYELPLPQVAVLADASQPFLPLVVAGGLINTLMGSGDEDLREAAEFVDALSGLLPPTTMYRDFIGNTAGALLLKSEENDTLIMAILSPAEMLATISSLIGLVISLGCPREIVRRTVDEMISATAKINGAVQAVRLGAAERSDNKVTGNVTAPWLWTYPRDEWKNLVDVFVSKVVDDQATQQPE